MNIRCLQCLLFFFAGTLCLCSQNISGTVTDERTGEPLPFVNVFYEGSRGVQTDSAGHYSLPRRKGKLYFSLIGYVSQHFTIKEATQLDVKLEVDNIELGVAVVRSKKKKYSRKNNPAVIMMQKVIAAKKKSDLSVHPYYSYNKYQKLTFALNEVSDKVFEDGAFRKVPFMKDHVEICPETGKKILPISVDETVTQQIYRKDPKAQKQIILGQQSTGISDLFSTGDILTTLIKDCFTDVDIYDDEVRLLQYPFHSPISTRSAISFYRYFIEDTVMVGKDKCFELSFTPNNPQDFGFAGTLFVMADSSYRVRRVEMGIPRHSGVNWVDNMMITQEFTQLPTGEQVLTTDQMLVELKIVKFIQRFQVKRLTEYSNYSLAPIPEQAFKFSGNVKTEPYARMQDDRFWDNFRSEKLTRSESTLDALVKRLSNIKGFKAILFVAKAFIENFVETSVSPEHPSKVDIGPINTMITQNFVDGLRLRASAQTTANLNPHLFLKGYVAYGFKDQRWKGMGEVTYSFNKKAYLPREFPVNNLTFSYSNDVMSPSDKFVPTDKDNVFVSLKWDKVDHMMYYENYRLFYDCEWNNGLRFSTYFNRSEYTPTASLFYQPLNGSTSPTLDGSNIRTLTTSEFNVGLIFRPGATYINTKQRRLVANNDAPIFALNHTVGIKNLFGGQYNYNYTEGRIYKRFWVGSWGRIDSDLRGGIQWNKVPFPLLIMPAANLSYIKEDYTFNLINNMEFLNDRFVSCMLSWDLNGKIFNRIPLIRKLKWREYIGCNVLWGMLSDKNNPYLNPTDRSLFYFPGRFNADGSFTTISHIMDKKTPYVEAVVGIHNIFKLLHVEYVRRLTYVDRPGVTKWGIRFTFRATF